MEGLLAETVIVGKIAAATVAVLFALLFLLSNYEQKREARRRYLRDLRESEARLQLALWGSGNWLWEYHVTSGRLFCEALARSLDWPPRRALPVALLAALFVHPQDRFHVRELPEKLAAGERELALELRVRLDAGEYRWLRWRGKVAVVDDAGQALRLTGTCKDVTDEHAADSQLRLGAQVMESVSDAIIVLDTDFRIIRVNRSFTDVSGYSSEEAIGRPVEFLRGPDDVSSDGASRFRRDVRSTLDAAGAWEGECWKMHKSGQRYFARMRVSEMSGESGNAAYYVAMLSDITRRKEAEEKLHFLANYDPMTGLMNRTSLVDHLQQAINRAERDSKSLAVLFLDLDHFKQINDSFGHAVGDDVLRAASKRISSTLRMEDAIARLGGDEFVVVIEQVKNRDNVMRVASKLIAAFRRELEIPQHALTVTPSVGISMYPDDGLTSQELLEHADTAMYQAKKREQSSWSFYEGVMSATARDALKRENQLRHALQENQLCLHYQPIMDSVRGSMIGMEALLRWQNPEAGLLMPNEFVRLAEERGLIVEIGAWVLRQACRDIAELNRRFGSNIYVSVNVSSIQVRDPDFIGHVGAALADSGLDSGLLHLELTESLIMDSSQHVLGVLHELKSYGIKLALDDFGTGYSSLSYLRRFPIDHLKIDKSFVRDVPIDADAASIVTTIIALGHTMNMGVTAEGVETLAQSHFLERCGCSEQQGFHFARPRALTGLEHMLASATLERSAKEYLIGR